MSYKIDEIKNLYEQYCRAANTKDKIHRGLKLAEKYHQFVDVFRQYEKLESEVKQLKALLTTNDQRLTYEDGLRDCAEQISQLKSENELLKTKLTELEESCVILIRVCKWCKSEYTGRCCENCEQEAGEV